MGLSVSVYKNVKLTESEEDHDFQVYLPFEGWKNKIKNLVQDGFYEGERESGYVQYSYSSHSRFREDLVKIMGREDLIMEDGRINWDLLIEEKELPFYELIWFSDCEGCLDHETSSIIYDDFLEWKEKAIEYFNRINPLNEKYLDWLQAFKSGKEEGSVVVFG